MSDFVYRPRTPSIRPETMKAVVKMEKQMEEETDRCDITGFTDGEFRAIGAFLVIVVLTLLGIVAFA